MPYHARVFTKGYTKRYLPLNGRGTRRFSSEYSEPLRMPEERVRDRAPGEQPALLQDDVQLVDPLEVLGLGDEQHVGVPAGADGRERLQEMVLAEVLAGGEHLALVRRAFLRVEAPPGGVDLQERVLDEVPVRHSGVSIGQYLRRRHAYRPGVPVLLDVPGRRDRPYRGTLGGATPDRPRCLGPRPGRPARPALRPLAQGGAAAGSGAARMARAARSDVRVPGERRGVEPGDDAGLGLAPAHGADGRRLRRGAPPRAARPDHLLGRAHGRRRPARRHVPLLLGQPADEQRRQRRRRLAAAEPAARADRGVRGGRLDRAALLRRPLPRHPQRRARRRRVSRGEAATAPG